MFHSLWLLCRGFFLTWCLGPLIDWEMAKLHPMHVVSARQKRVALLLPAIADTASLEGIASAVSP